MCPNATIVNGYDKGCDGIVCRRSDSVSCKSGKQCVDRGKICHGFPVCDDASDLAKCRTENNVCPPHYKYSQCSADYPTDHQECFDSGFKKSNQEFNCILRGDEPNQKTLSETIDYASITPCGDPGDTKLMCGLEC